MHLICAKEFCKKTGAPLQTVRRLCREGKIPYVQSGRAYMMDEQKAVSIMQDEMQINANRQMASHKKFDFLAAIDRERRSIERSV